MNKTRTTTNNGPRRRGRPRVPAILVQVRLPLELARRLDRWRANYCPAETSRPAALKRLIERLKA